MTLTIDLTPAERARRDAGGRTDPQTDAWTAQAQEALDRLSTFPDGWDGDGTEAPNPTALAHARRALAVCVSLSLRPDRIAPAAEGGVMLSFYVGKRYGDLELFNTGEILAVTSPGPDGTGPQVWEVTDDETAIRSALETLRVHVAA